MNTISHFNGWVPDLPDFRDYGYVAPPAILADLPPKTDLTQNFPGVYFQGNINTCTSNAIAAAFHFEIMQQKMTSFPPSRLFIYYNQRVYQDTVNTDSGASLRDGLHSLKHQGVCSNDKWDYIINEFTKKPFESCYRDALKHKIKNYYSLEQDINQMKACLADGHPFVFGFSVYESFFDDKVKQQGIADMPGKKDKRVFGHAAVAVGYDDASSRFIVRNSWANSWGNQGNFTIPYEYLSEKRLSQSFWTIRLVNSTTDAATSAESQQNGQK